MRIKMKIILKSLLLLQILIAGICHAQTANATSSPVTFYEARSP